MLCPQCGYNDELIEGECARCGYGRAHTHQVSLFTPQTSPIAPAHTFSRGDTLSKGRYRLN